MGKVVISISTCEKLVYADFNNSSDPYVYIEARFGNVVASFKTKTIKKNLNPTFNETFELDGVFEQDLEKATLLLQVFDWDMLSSDDLLGECKFDATAIKNLISGSHSFSSSLGDGKGKVNGEVKGINITKAEHYEEKPTVVTSVAKSKWGNLFGTGKIEAKQSKLQDSNVALIGSKLDIEQRVKAAKTEKEWAVAGKKPGLQIWRIENFKVVPWSTTKYGEFHIGDSYIILNTYKKNEKTDALCWNIHFWLGSESSQDEMGTAAYKTVELDDLLGGGPVQYRECQGFESTAFMTLFTNGIRILMGGVDSGFKHVESKAFKPRLFHIKGKRAVVTEVEMICDSLNAGDVFILDNGADVYLWIGEKCDKNESWKGVAVSDELVDSRKPKANFIRLDQKDGKDQNDTFWKLLGGKKTIKTADQGGNDMENEAKRQHQLWQLTDSSGRLEFKLIAEGSIKYEQFKSEDCFIADCGDAIICWIGSKASNDEKSKAFEYSVKYMNGHNRPAWLPIVKVTEGNENPQFFKYVKK